VESVALVSALPSNVMRPHLGGHGARLSWRLTRGIGGAHTVIGRAADDAMSMKVGLALPPVAAPPDAVERLTLYVAAMAVADQFTDLADPATAVSPWARRVPKRVPVDGVEERCPSGGAGRFARLAGPEWWRSASSH
jgi:hypothetical protein